MSDLSSGPFDVLINGTGYYAEVMLTDLAVAARSGLKVGIGGRNQDRIKWLVEACRARAVNYGADVEFGGVTIDSSSAEALAEDLQRVSPRVVVQSASMQSPWRVDNDESDWSRLVGKAGFGLTIAFNSLLSFRVASALKMIGGRAHFVNTCYPDGVNQVLAQADLPITTGVGNIGIFASVIGGRIPRESRGDLRVLAHHRHIVEWRKKGTDRAGPPVRAWIGDEELSGIDDLTRDIRLPHRDLNLISAANAVPVILALAGERDCRSHVPGPGGLGGGYPVKVTAAGVTVDLPSTITVEEARAWNRGFEDADGVSVREGRVVYAPRIQKLLAEYSPELAGGFDVQEVELAVRDLGQLRAKLGG